MGVGSIRDEEDCYLEVAVQAAHAAGEILQSWASRFTVSEKGPSDLVTEADFASQAKVAEIISTAFPDHTLLGEENLNRSVEGSDFRWIIDPLDGTSNYVHGFPYYCVSIGLEWRGDLFAGVIFDPNRNELFTAQAGCGAFVNGKPIRPSRTTEMSDAFLVASLPRRADPRDTAVARFLRAIPVAESVQRTGSAALNLAYVACGRMDAFWSSSLKPWDMAAGALLVREAGGTLTNLSGEAFDWNLPEVLATNGPALHASVLDLMVDPQTARL